MEAHQSSLVQELGGSEELYEHRSFHPYQPLPHRMLRKGMQEQHDQHQVMAQLRMVSTFRLSHHRSM